MGMFDTIRLNCPHCASSRELQSKAGECVLDVFEVEDAPVEILNDINGEKVLCGACGRPSVVKTRTYCELVPLSPKEGGDE